MIKQNKLILHFSKRETALKWLFFSFGYFILFVFLENPLYKTISLIGREHIILFSVFCFIYSVGTLTNLFYMKNNFEIKNKFLYNSAVFMTSMFGLVATTLMPNKAVGDISLFATIVHWIFGFGGIVVNTVAALIILLSIAKKESSKKLKLIFGACTSICILDLLIFLITSVLARGNVQKSKNGFLEIVPMTVTFFVLYIINHTDLVSSCEERNEREKSIKVRDESIFSALCFGSLGFAFIVFTLFAFVRNPIHYTISMTGTDYPIGFAVTSTALACAFILNFIMMFRKNSYRNAAAWFLGVAGSLSIIVCVVSPTKMGTELDLVHSVAALMFFYFILASFLLYYFHFRKDKKRKPFLISIVAILIAASVTILLMFVIFKQKYGRTGLTEVIPLEFCFLCFYLENHSEYFSKIKETKEVSLR